MQTAYFFKNMQQAEQEQVLSYMEKKLPRLTKLLKNFPEDGLRLHITGERFDKHNAYNLLLNLRINADDYMAGETSHAITKAIDFSVDRLEAQLSKAAETMRRSQRTIKTRRSLKDAVTEKVMVAA